MDAVTAVIDLGELGYGRDQEDVGQRPGWSPRARRWLLVALVAAVVAPLTGAAAPARQPPLTPLWTVAGTMQRSVALTGDTLYAIGRQPGGGLALARHDLATGAVRWTTPLPDARDWPAVEVAGDVPIAIGPGRAGAGQVTAYDPVTGVQRWRHEGWPAWVVAGGRLVLDRWQPGPPPEGGIPPSDLVAVDIGTGEIAWTIQTAADGQELYGWGGRPEPGADPTVLVTVGEGGRLTRHDLSTGAEVVAGQLPLGQPYTGGGGGSVAAALFSQLETWVFASELGHPAVADGLVMLTGPGGTVTAYDLATLAPRWRLPGHRWAAPCGPVVCAVDDGLTELAAIDPDTGSVRWSWDCRRGGTVGGSCYVLPTALGPGDPMLVQQWQLGQGGVDTAWLVEPATGVPVAELGQWRALGRLDAGSWLLRWVDENEPVLGRGVPPERTWLARLTVDPVELEVLGSIEAPTCLPHRSYLVCWPGEETDAVVWRVS
jgi:outer membrane protein assembly factor BamB